MIKAKNLVVALAAGGLAPENTAYVSTYRSYHASISRVIGRYLLPAHSDVVFQYGQHVHVLIFCSISQFT